MHIPDGFVAYSRSPVFTQETVPVALLKSHETKRGVWALIHVLEGRLRYHVEASRSAITLELGTAGVVAPGALHHVEPLGPVRFFLEFFRPDSKQRPLPHSAEAAQAAAC